MNTKEKNAIVKWAANLSNEELEQEYYDAVFDSLGSVTEDMYDLGYDMQDIEEQEEFEEYKCHKADILEKECSKRGVKLWQEENNA